VERLHAQHGVRVDERRVDGCAGNDAVIVLGISLHFGQSLAATGRAALEVAALGGPRVVARYHRLAGHRGDVRRAMAEIDDRIDIGLAGAVIPKDQSVALVEGWPMSFCTTA
jgi:hypothetical protein